MKAERIVPRLVIGILCVGGLALLALGISLLVPVLRSASWMSVQGVITGHRIESVYQNQSTVYQVGVNYVYEAGQTRHTGRLFSHASSPLPMTYRSREAAEAAYASDPNLRDWQSGRAVTVFYDPQDPAQAVLQTGASGLAWGVCLLGTGITALAGREGWKLRRRVATSGDES
ncbi:MAG: DUF3592 domain-containing protein [Prosthecobacter sp.]